MTSCKRFALYNYIIALDIILTLLYTSNMLVQTVRLNMIDVGRSKSLATTCSLYIATQLSRFLKAMLSFENIFSVKHFFYYFAQLASTACVMISFQFVAGRNVTMFQIQLLTCDFELLPLIEALNGNMVSIVSLDLHQYAGVHLTCEFKL